MNFDDLHDPQPPRPGPAALAAVAGRARRIRRRRTGLAIAGGVAALAAIAVPAALVATDDGGDGGRIVPAEPQSTVAPSTTASSTTSPATTTLPAAVVPVRVVAIHGNGDAVAIDLSGAETLLYDGADPADPPAEGELTVVDSVVATDGRLFVSTCCEPVPGAWFEVGAGGQPASDDVRYGHALALSPDGGRIASVGTSGITVSDLDGAILASADLSASPVHRQPESVMWLDDDTLAVIELRQPDSGAEFRLSTVDAALTAVATVEGAVIGTDLDSTWPHFGGLADDGSILVYRGARGGTVSDRLEAYDPATLAARPASDIVLPDPAVDAWYDGSLTWVGIDDVLHVDASEIPGEFAWARPAG